MEGVLRRTRPSVHGSDGARVCDGAAMNAAADADATRPLRHGTTRATLRGRDCQTPV